MKNNCINVYAYHGVHDNHTQYIEELKWLFQNYRTGFVRLAISYADDGQTDEAKEVLEIMDDRIPENLIPYMDDQMKKEIEALYKKVSEGS